MDVLAVILLSFSLVSGFDYAKRCLLHGNSCVSRCPHKMHAYHTRCEKDTLSQRTCKSQHIIPLGYTCGWSRCDCNGDLVLDEESMECVSIDLCPVVKKSKGRRRKKYFKVPKDIGSRVIDEGDLIDI